jgi:hypothetical protein
MPSIAEDIEANERVYESLRPGMEATHSGQWVVVMDGRLVAVAPTREEALRRAGPVPPSAPSRLVRQLGEPLPSVVRKL